MKHATEYRDAEISREIRRSIDSTVADIGRAVRIMEVCGTHTVSIFKSGIRSLLPEAVQLLSGPGCPVCVTGREEIDALCFLANQPNVITATFGDMMRVPGTNTSLADLKAAGRDVRIVYSAMDAVKMAADNPDKTVVTAGIGFETTAPTIAASILAASRMNLANYLVFSCHKRVIPALYALMAMEDVRIDAFLLPGHVSVIIGEDEYAPFVETFQIPCAIAGFEPADILAGIRAVVRQIFAGRPRLDNCYPRGVHRQGNTRAKAVMADVFEIADANWRGIGTIPASGLKIRSDYGAFDAEKQFAIPRGDPRPPSGCKCGRVLTGRIIPPECLLYGKSCTPASPVGPCMVSSEGTCAAYHRFEGMR